eukprot:gene8000-9395_t
MDTYITSPVSLDVKPDIARRSLNDMSVLKFASRETPRDFGYVLPHYPMGLDSQLFVIGYPCKITLDKFKEEYGQGATNLDSLYKSVKKSAKRFEHKVVSVSSSKNNSLCDSSLSTHRCPALGGVSGGLLGSFNSTTHHFIGVHVGGDQGMENNFAISVSHPAFVYLFFQHVVDEDFFIEHAGELHMYFNYYKDIKSKHANEGNQVKGLVKPDLVAFDGQVKIPELVSLSATDQKNIDGRMISPQLFKYFFAQDTVNNTNIPLKHTLQFNTSIVKGESIYSYLNSAFFPIDKQGFDNQTLVGYVDKKWIDGRGVERNFHFCLRMNTVFTMVNGSWFSFFGDDDFWVFINDKIVLDEGGVHSSEGGKVNLNDLKPDLQVGKNYTFDLYFCERAPGESNFLLETNIVLMSPLLFNVLTISVSILQYRHQITTIHVSSRVATLPQVTFHQFKLPIAQYLKSRDASANLFALVVEHVSRLHANVLINGWDQVVSPRS